MVKTFRGRKVKTTEKKNIYDREMEMKRNAAKRRQSKKWTISAKKSAMFKGSDLRKGARAIQDVEQGVEHEVERGIEGVEHVGLRGFEGVKHDIESGLTGLEHGLRRLSVNKMEDEMADLQKRISKLGGKSTLRRPRKSRHAHKKRTHSMKKR